MTADFERNAKSEAAPLASDAGARRITRRRYFANVPSALASLFIIGWCAGAAPVWAAGAGEDILTKTRSAVKAANLTPYDVGSRYGQALGAAETCDGGRITDKGAVLRALYTGEDLERFSAQENKIYEAWMRVKHCTTGEGSNICKVVIEESCAAAMAEIGPAGSAFPGLFQIARP
jgi:hypothetical protein